MNMDNSSIIVSNLAIEVPLTRGMVALIDEADSELIRPFRWMAVAGGGNKRRFDARAWLPRNGGRQKSVVMHRLIMAAPNGIEVDHINGNALDNRRCNLRLCSHLENSQNRHRPWGAVALKGVSVINRGALLHCWYRAIIKHDGKVRYLGAFRTAEDAARAYDAAAIRLFGEFACTNESLGLLEAAP